MKKTNNKTDKWDMDLNKEFSKEESQMAEKYLNLQHPQPLKKCKSKSTLRFQFIPIRMSKNN